MRILTQNLYFKQHGEEKIKKITHFFRGVSPDILVFQEAVSDETEQVKKELNLSGDGYYLYEGWEDEAKTIEVKSGTSVLYQPQNLDLISFESVILDNPPKIGENGMNKSYSCFAGWFKLKDRVLGIVSVHLSVDYADRMNEAKVLVGFIKSKFTKADGIIILGDFNSNSQGGGYNADSYVKDSGFKNVWEVLKPGVKCVTYRGVEWWVKNHPEHRQTRKYIKKKENFGDDALDFILYKGNINFSSIDTFDLTPDVSDHLGLMADFEVN